MGIDAMNSFTPYPFKEVKSIITNELSDSLKDIRKSAFIMDSGLNNLDLFMSLQILFVLDCFEYSDVVSQTWKEKRL